jgi:hypothetical protein
MNTFLGSPLVMMVIIMVIFLYPVARILKRTGHSGWWALLMVPSTLKEKHIYLY